MDEKLDKEIKVLKEMILLYCHRNHMIKNGEECCKECQELIEYGTLRVINCPFMETKTFCSNCKVHCYRPDMRERIRKVMRYSGPRIIFKHPRMAIWHVITSIKEKSKKR